MLNYKAKKNKEQEKKWLAISAISDLELVKKENISLRELAFILYEEKYDFELYEKIQAQNPSLNIIASGGVANMDDLNQLKEMNLFGVIVGKAFYEGRITLNELASFANNTSC